MIGAAAAGFTPGAFPFKQPQMAIASWKNPEESAEAIKHEAIQLTEEAIKALGGMSRFVSSGDVVFIKPNIGWNTMPEVAACTNPDVVGTLVRLCYEAGANKVRVSDNSCHVPQRTFLRSGIKAAAEAEGAEVFYMDRRKFKNMDTGGRNLKSWPIYVDYVECDKRINVPIPKDHSLCGLTLSIKNLMGIIGGERNRIHQNLGPAMADIAKFVPSDLVVLDAVRIMTGNGPTGGSLADVARRDVVAAGVDTVAIDAYATTLFGMKQDMIVTTRAGVEAGLGTSDFESLNPVRIDV